MISNFKMILMLALFGGSSLAMAGTQGPVGASDLYHGFYAEGAVGWTFSNWKSAINYIFPSQVASQFNNLHGGFSGGGDIGYKLNPYFSMEVGAFSLPKIKYTIQSAAPGYIAKDMGSISNWLIDFAGKITIPVTKITGVDAVGKFGVAYRAGNYIDQETYNGAPNSVVQPSVFNIIEPILGGGLQYHMSEHWVIDAQYLFMPYGILSTTILGPTMEDHGSIPSAQIATLGVGFYF